MNENTEKLKREFDLESHVAFYLNQGWHHGDNCSCKKFAIAKAKLENIKAEEPKQIR